MKIENEWLEKEIICLEREMKSRKKDDGMQYMKIIFVLFMVFFYGNIDAKHSFNSVNYAKAVDGGQTFYCHKCQTRQWHDNSTADWNGKFYCGGCKTKLN